VPGRPREFDSSLCFLDVSASKNLDYDDVVLSLRDDQVSSGMIRNAFNRRSVYICKLRYVANPMCKFIGLAALRAGGVGCPADG